MIENPRKNYDLENQKQKLEFALYLTKISLGLVGSVEDFVQNLRIRSFRKMKNEQVDIFINDELKEWDLIVDEVVINKLLNYKKKCELYLSDFEYKNTYYLLELKIDESAKFNAYAEFEEFMYYFEWFISQIISSHDLKLLESPRHNDSPLYGLFLRLEMSYKSICNILDSKDLKILNELYSQICDFYLKQGVLIYFDIESNTFGNNFDSSILKFDDSLYSNLSPTQKIDYIKGVKFYYSRIFNTLNTSSKDLLSQKIGNESIYQKYCRFKRIVNLFLSKIINYNHSHTITDPTLTATHYEIINLGNSILPFFLDKDKQTIADCISLCDVIYDFKPKTMVYRDNWLE